VRPARLSERPDRDHSALARLAGGKRGNGAQRGGRHARSGGRLDLGPAGRLLPYLATHLTFREIGERLYISRHTVKSQAMANYRKLNVSSRGGAVDRARELGLL